MSAPIKKTETITVQLMNNSQKERYPESFWYLFEPFQVPLNEEVKKLLAVNEKDPIYPIYPANKDNIYQLYVHAINAPKK